MFAMKHKKKPLVFSDKRLLINAHEIFYKKGIRKRTFLWLCWCKGSKDICNWQIKINTCGLTHRQHIVCRHKRAKILTGRRVKSHKNLLNPTFRFH